MARSIRVWAVAGAVGVLVAGALVLLLLDAIPSGGSWSSSSGPSSVASSPTPYADPAAARFPVVTASTAEIAGAPAQVFLPLASSAARAPEPYPLAVLLPDPAVDPGQYAQLAHDVAGFGFVVVVPSSARPDADVLVASVAWARALETEPSDPAHGLVDPGVVVVLTPKGNTVGLCVPAEVSRIDCAAADARTARLTLDGLGALAMTNEGRRGPRVSDALSSVREEQIDRIARRAGWWALARTGDPDAGAVLARLDASSGGGITLLEPGG